MSDDVNVPAHIAKQSHSYYISFPEHPARTADPHYVDFEAFKRRTKATARCEFAVRTGDDSECDLASPLETHHSHIEFSLQNGVDLKWLERDYPGVSDPTQVGAWVESAANLVWLCAKHHRGPGGVHSAAAADYEAEHYVRGLISK